MIIEHSKVKYTRLEQRLVNIAREIYVENYHDDKRHFHMSFAVAGNRVLSMGTNQSFKTHSLGKRFSSRFSSTHSELSCFISARWMDIKWNKIDWFNIKIGNDIKNHIAPVKLSCPCDSCKMLLKEVVGVKQVHYTNNNGEFETMRF